MSAAKAVSSEPGLQTVPEPRAPDPSMEDILASIRRIIADDQTRHASLTPPRVPPAPLTRTAPPVPAASHPVTAPTGMTRVAAPAPPPPAGRDGLVARAPLAPAPAPVRAIVPPVPATATPAAAPAMVTPAPAIVPPTPPVVRPVSRPAIESRTTPVNGTAVPPHLNPPAMSDIQRPDDFLIDEIAKAGRVSALQSAAADPTQAPTVTLTPEANDMPKQGAVVSDLPAVNGPLPAIPATPVPPAEPVSDAAPERPSNPETVAEAATDVASVPETAAAPEALVSTEAGATIETSFHALATSVFLQNNGMVESLMRDMLRPMLKSWLDDNLPAIVERLVRVEIERVARGGRA